VTRIVSLALAIVTGLCAAVLVAWGPTVQFRGHTRSCNGIIASAESYPYGRGSGPCHDKERQWAMLAGLAAFVCLSAGSVALLSRRDEEGVVRPGP
jgi:hypothetical protein